MKVVLTNVRLSFPHLFTPQAGTDGGEPKYNATFIVEPGSVNAKALAAAVSAVAKEKWADKATATLTDVWPQDNAYGKRVIASLKGVQFVKNGDAFSGGAPASADEFDVVEAPEEADDLV
jgi:hypothetical protein